MPSEEFLNQVEEICETEYDILDAGDLCFNLFESGVINSSATVEQAARIVAQHCQQA